nr:efflux pump rdc3 [Quercus suber]
MLFTSPVIFVASLYSGLVYGYMYILFTSFPTVYQQIYGFTEGTVGLTYLSFGIGCCIALVLFARYSDRLVRRFSKEREWQAEYRLLPLLPSSLFLPVGLLWFGWSVEARVHWIMPMIGTGIVGFGVLGVFTSTNVYLIDAFSPHSASAAAANTVFRSLTGAVLPLAGSHLWRALGDGWGNTLLALLALLFTPISVMVYRYGKRLRTSFQVNE